MDPSSNSSPYHYSSLHHDRHPHHNLHQDASSFLHQETQQAQQHHPHQQPPPPPPQYAAVCLASGCEYISPTEQLINTSIDFIQQQQHQGQQQPHQDRSFILHPHTHPHSQHQHPPFLIPNSVAVSTTTSTNIPQHHSVAAGELAHLATFNSLFASATTAASVAAAAMPSSSSPIASTPTATATATVTSILPPIMGSLVATTTTAAAAQQHHQQQLVASASQLQQLVMSGESLHQRLSPPPQTTTTITLNPSPSPSSSSSISLSHHYHLLPPPPPSAIEDEVSAAATEEFRLNKMGNGGGEEGEEGEEQGLMSLMEVRMHGCHAVPSQVSEVVRRHNEQLQQRDEKKILLASEEVLGTTAEMMSLGGERADRVLKPNRADVDAGGELVVEGEGASLVEEENGVGGGSGGRNKRQEIKAPSAPTASSSIYPRELDYNQPAKSWWRYYEKLANFRALCLGCGHVINQGEKRSTNSLSQHLRRHHPDRYIMVQRAKDAELLLNPKSTQLLASDGKDDSIGGGLRRSERKSVGASSLAISNALDEMEEGSVEARTRINRQLIRLVRARPILYKAPLHGAEQLMEGVGSVGVAASADDISAVISSASIERELAWQEIATEMGVDGGDASSVSILKARWASLRERFGRELKYQVRDNFAYTPKWLHYTDLKFLYEENGLAEVGPAVGVVGLAKALHNNSADALGGGTTPVRRPVGRPPKRPKLDGGGVSATASSSSSARGLLGLHDGAPMAMANVNESEADGPISRLLQEFLNTTTHSNAACNSTSPKPSHLSSAVSSTPTTSGQFDWLKDEDYLFGRIIALRLKGMSNVDRKHKMKIAIEQLFEMEERGEYLS